ncbi:isochorismatase family protein [Myceligenerans cantabricum]
MAIPAIPSYRLPAADELPANRPAWEVDPARALLLVHDMQEYFVRPFGDRLRAELVSGVAALRRAFHAAGAPVAYSAQPGAMTPEQRGLLADIWGPGMSGDPADTQIVDDVAPSGGDTVLTKWRPSAFFGTGLLELLRESGRDQLVVTGVYGHVGLLMTAHEAFSHDIETFVAADAMADFSRRHHVETLEYLAGRCAKVALAADLAAAVSVESWEVAA